MIYILGALRGLKTKLLGHGPATGEFGAEELHDTHSFQFHLYGYSVEHDQMGMWKQRPFKRLLQLFRQESK